MCVCHNSTFSSLTEKRLPAHIIYFTQGAAFTLRMISFLIVNNEPSDICSLIGKQQTKTDNYMTRNSKLKVHRLNTWEKGRKIIKYEKIYLKSCGVFPYRSNQGFKLGFFGHQWLTELSSLGIGTLYLSTVHTHALCFEFKEHAIFILVTFPNLCPYLLQQISHVRWLNKMGKCIK